MQGLGRPRTPAEGRKAAKHTDHRGAVVRRRGGRTSRRGPRPLGQFGGAGPMASHAPRRLLCAMPGPEFSLPTKRHITSMAGSRCSHCNDVVVGPDVRGIKPVNVGEIAHIRGKAPGTARYDPNMSDEDRAHESNGLLLCPTCHTRVDKDWARFPPETLQRWRREREAAARDGGFRFHPLKINWSTLHLPTVHAPSYRPPNLAGVPVEHYLLLENANNAPVHDVYVRIESPECIVAHRVGRSVSASGLVVEPDSDGSMLATSEAPVEYTSGGSQLYKVTAERLAPGGKIEVYFMTSNHPEDCRMLISSVGASLTFGAHRQTSGEPVYPYPPHLRGANMVVVRCNHALSKEFVDRTFRSALIAEGRRFTLTTPERVPFGFAASVQQLH